MKLAGTSADEKTMGTYHAIPVSYGGQIMTIEVLYRKATPVAEPVFPTPYK